MANPAFLAQTLVTLAEEAHSEGGGANPYVIGAVTLAILLLVLMAVVAVGGGREHS